MKRTESATGRDISQIIFSEEAYNELSLVGLPRIYI